MQGSGSLRSALHTLSQHERDGCCSHVTCPGVCKKRLDDLRNGHSEAQTEYADMVVLHKEVRSEPNKLPSSL